MNYLIKLFSSIFFYCLTVTLFAQVSGVTAIHDTSSTSADNPVVVNVLCNDFENTTDTLFEDLILGEWKLFSSLNVSSNTITLYEDSYTIAFDGTTAHIEGYDPGLAADVNADCSYTTDGTGFTFDSCLIFGLSTLPVTLYDSAMVFDAFASVTGEILTFNPNDALTATIITNGNYGTATVNAAGNIFYETTEATAQIDTIVYTACNAMNMCDTAFLIITIEGESVAPPNVIGITASNDAATVLANNPTEINVLCNDFDLTMNPILRKWKLVEASFGLGGSFEYADTMFSLTFDGTSVIEDGYNPENSMPLNTTCSYYFSASSLDFDACSYFGDVEYDIVINDSSLFIDGGIALDGPGWYFLSDDSLTVTLIENGTYGTASINADGNIDYTTTEMYQQIDTIVYAACNALQMCDTAFLIITIDGPVGNTNFDFSNINVYPNPTEDLLNITLNENEIKRLEIFTSEGKRIENLNQQSQINVSDFSDGIYFLKATMQNGKIYRTKFLKN